jgi:methylated-DNA-[protein]-cysteine S-methyltransferase
VTYRFVDTLIGGLLLARDAAGLRLIHFLRSDDVEADLQVGPVKRDWRRDDDDFNDVVTQLAEYFDGRRREFDLSLAPEGTPFQQLVWRALLDIPYGETTSYGELATRIGQRSASRAVGLANGSNPLPIVIPCHRVIGANGKLTGYGGGLAIKDQLLALERGERRLVQ